MTSDKVRAKVAEARTRAVEVILGMMQREGLNWVCQWDSGALMPCNGSTGRRYHGGNRLHLMAVACARGYSEPRWFTFKQAREMGYAPRKGEKSAVVEYWKPFRGMKDAAGEWTDDPGAAVEIASYTRLVGYFSVFNAQQLADAEGRPMPAETKPGPVLNGELCAVADVLIGSSRCPVSEGEGIAQACYMPALDRIEMPPRKGFASMEAFLTVLAHEMTHSTMKPFGREGRSGGSFGSKAYAYEELVAELGSTFACIDLGIHRVGNLEGDENFENHAAYLKSWLGALSDDPDYLFRAAAEADRAASYIVERYEAANVAGAA